MGSRRLNSELVWYITQKLYPHSWPQYEVPKGTKPQNYGDPWLIMDLHNWFMEIHNSFMEIHNSRIDGDP